MIKHIDMRALQLCILLIIGLSSTILSQDKNNTWTRLKTDSYHMADGFVHVLSSPIRWDGKDWLKFGGVAAGVYLVSFLDQPVSDWAARTTTFGRWRRLENFADLTGKPVPAVIAFTALYGFGVVFDKGWMRDSGILIFGSLAATSLLQSISKTATGRARPISGFSNADFKPFSKDPDFHSFPSGHAMASLNITAVLAHQVQSVPVKIALYAIGFGTGLARVYNQAHWVSDVALSTVITLLSVKSVIKRYEAKKGLSHQPTSVYNQKNSGTWIVSPMYKGLRLNYQF